MRAYPALTGKQVDAVSPARPRLYSGESRHITNSLSYVLHRGLLNPGTEAVNLSEMADV